MTKIITTFLIILSLSTMVYAEKQPITPEELKIIQTYNKFFKKAVKWGRFTCDRKNNMKDYQDCYFNQFKQLERQIIEKGW